MKVVPALVVPALLTAASLSSAAPNRAWLAPNVDPHRLVLELTPGTPRPGLGRVRRTGMAPEPLASSGLPALDAVHARYQPLVYEPMFPTARPPVAGSRDEDLTRFYLVELPAD